jgi:allantoinase
MLPGHGRYPYSPITGRPDYTWPGGKRLAVYLALNVEHFAFGEAPGADFSAPAVPPHHRSYAWREYGNRVGIWRLLDLFEELRLPVALLVNSEIYDYCPEIIAPYRKRGDEIVGHGRTNTLSLRQADLSEKLERELIAECTATLTRHEGKPPRGWLGPWISQSWVTPDLLKEAGYRYMLDWHFDDQPVWFSTRAGPLLAVPYPAMEVNDSPAFIYRRVSEDHFAGMIVDQFDELLEQSRKQPLVCPISLHTFIVGQPFRLRRLRRALRHIADHAGEIWLTRPGQIAEHVESLPAGTVPGR